MYLILLSLILVILIPVIIILYLRSRSKRRRSEVALLGSNAKDGDGKVIEPYLMTPPGGGAVCLSTGSQPQLEPAQTVLVTVPVPQLPPAQNQAQVQVQILSSKNDIMEPQKAIPLTELPSDSTTNVDTQLEHTLNMGKSSQPIIRNNPPGDFTKPISVPNSGPDINSNIVKED